MRERIQGDMLQVGREAQLGISVVCPFFNEEQILAEAITSLLARLEKLTTSWELIVVDDGSTDASREVAQALAREAPRLRVLHYPRNRGRGHALLAGIQQARGEIIITTEIDLSWGEDIVERLFEAIRAHPEADLIVASPHLPGGGYRNVPAKRVLLSRFGNWVIRACMSNAATMNTGMTRAYRRDAIRSLPLESDSKEFHLEVILKAQALDYRIQEIPSVLEWKEYKHAGRRVERKSGSNVNRFVLTHTLFSLFANPVRYVWVLAALTLLLSFGFLVTAMVLYAMQLVSAYSAIMSLGLAIMAIVLFALGVIAQQGNMIQREIWRLKQDLWHAQQGATGPREPPRPPERES